MMQDNDSCIHDDTPDIPVVFRNSTTLQRVVIGTESFVAVLIMCLYILDLTYYVKTIEIKSQLKSVLIIQGVYVVYAFTSLFSIYSPRSGTLVELVFSVYFSFVLKELLKLMLDYLVEDFEISDSMSGKTVSLATPPLACCFWLCCPRVYSNKRFILFVKIGVYQTVFIRPALSFVSAVLWTNGMDVLGLMNANSPAFYLSLMEIFSTLFAMYASTMLYRASYFLLKHYNMKGKFICVQVVMIVSAAQLFIFSFMANKGIIPCRPPLDSKHRASVLQHCVVIPEMFILLLVSRHFYKNSNAPLHASEYQALLSSAYPNI